MASALLLLQLSASEDSLVPATAICVCVCALD